MLEKVQNSFYGVLAVVMVATVGYMLFTGVRFGIELFGAVQFALLVGAYVAFAVIADRVIPRRSGDSWLWFLFDLLLSGDGDGE